MRIDINLASQPYEDAQRFWTSWGTGLALLCLATTLLGFMATTRFINASRERKEIADMESVIARFDSRPWIAEVDVPTAVVVTARCEHRRCCRVSGLSENFW